jgi:hypothetical protein
MSAGALELLRELAGETCAGCDSQMVITYDALRRPRKRCPKCDGLSKPRAPHPDTVLVPVALKPLAMAAGLPPVEPGQLRCQRCARGVDGDVRFCEERTALRSMRPCLRCHVPFLGTRRWQKRCDRCLAAAAAPTVTVCTGCNRLWPRKKRGKFRVASCAACWTDSRPADPVRTCLSCGATSPRAHRGHKTVKRCSLCRSMRTCLGCGATSRRSSHQRSTVKKCSACPSAPRIGMEHPGTLPDDHPRRIAWIAASVATRTARGDMLYKPKSCRECGTQFQPTGPRSLYCPTHR